MIDFLSDDRLLVGYGQTVGGKMVLEFGAVWWSITAAVKLGFLFLLICAFMGIGEIVII